MRQNLFLFYSFFMPIHLDFIECLCNQAINKIFLCELRRTKYGRLKLLPGQTLRSSTDQHNTDAVDCLIITLSLMFCTMIIVEAKKEEDALRKTEIQQFDIVIIDIERLNGSARCCPVPCCYCFYARVSSTVEVTNRARPAILLNSPVSKASCTRK